MRTPNLAYTLSLLLLAATPAVAQFSSPATSLMAPPPDPTAYGLEIIRAEHWRPQGATTETAPGADSLSVQDEEKNDKEPKADKEIDDSIASYRAMIRELEIAQGPYSNDLAEAFTGLAYNYQHSGDHTAAVDSFKRAIHLTRINRGPFTQDQIPMLDAMRESLLAEKRMADLDPLQEYIYFVHRRVMEPGDPRLLQATRDYVQWQRSAYLQAPGDSGDRLLTLEKLFSDTLDTLEEQGAPAAALLQPLRGAMQIAYLLDFHGGHQQPDFQVQFRQPNMPVYAAEESRLRQLQQINYRRGLRTARELVDAMDGEAPEARARALVEEGDWYQWAGKSVSARRSYREAYELLSGGEAERDKLFAEPVELPDDLVFLPAAPLDQREPRGRARVRFDVSSRGKLRNLEVLSLSPEDRGAELSLRRMLRRLHFRPRLEDGEAVETTGIEREYIFFENN